MSSKDAPLKIETKIEPQIVYRGAVLFGSKGLRSARKAGLVCRYYGRTVYVYGADAIDFLLKTASTEPPTARKEPA